MFQKIFPSLEASQQVKFLNKAALEWSVGGPFFPGIEMTYVAYDKKTFHEKHDFRYGGLQTLYTCLSYF